MNGVKARTGVLYAKNPLVRARNFVLLPSHSDTAALRHLECVEHEVLHDAPHFDRIALNRKRDRPFGFEKKIALSRQIAHGVAVFLE